MREVPSSIEGLAWIANNKPDQLLLIRRLDVATIKAAAMMDQQALTHLHATAQAAASNAHNMSDAVFWDLAASCQHDPAMSALHPEIQEAGCLAVTSGRQVKFTMSRLRLAAQEGRLVALQWLKAICQPVNPRVTKLIEAAAAGGQLHVLQHLCSGPNQSPRGARLLMWTRQHPECMAFLFTLQPRLQCRDDDAEDLASDGNLHALQLLHAHGALEVSLQQTYALSRAVVRGHQPVAEWLRSLHPPCPWNADVLSAATHPSAGGLAMLQWMRQQPPCPWDESCTAQAAKWGNMQALQWMRAQDPPCPWDAQCYITFACRGNLPALQWLRSQKPACPWNKSCTRLAAMEGNLEMLQWLRQQEPPCPWDAGTSQQAALRGDVPMLKWIRSQRGPVTGKLYVTAVRSQHVHVVQWLHQEKVPTTGQRGPCKGMSVPVLMGDIGYGLSPFMQNVLVQARRALCTFHGLVRWCSRPGSNPRQHSVHRHGRVSLYSRRASGEDLLVGLARLPPELVTKIAVAAQLQHDLL